MPEADNPGLWTKELLPQEGARVRAASLCLPVWTRQGRKKERFPWNTSSQRVSTHFGCCQLALHLLLSAALRRSHSSHTHTHTPYPPLGTWICCTMVRSCTRNSLASLALSDNPFRAWESWLCGEKEGRPEMLSHRATWSYFKTAGPQTQEPLSLP